MMPGRLRECLRILRWSETELAAALGRQPAEVGAWLDGRGRAPLAVTAWLEALAKAHLAVPPPLRTAAKADGPALTPERFSYRSNWTRVSRHFMQKGGTDAIRQV